MSKTQTQIFTDIPPEIWIIIFSNLKITDAANLGRVNKQMWKIYLDLVRQTKYIEYIKYREPPNNDITKYIKSIMHNMRMGNRSVILKMNHDEDILPEPAHQSPPSPLFKIINISVITESNYALRIHVMNDENICIIHFNIDDNIITCEGLGSCYAIQFIVNTPFNAKMRPLKYTFENNQLEKQ